MSKQGPVRLVRVMVGEERRNHLRHYIRCCIRDSALSWSDVMSPAILDKLLKVLSKDVRIIVVEFGKQAGANLMNVGATMLAGFAEKTRK